VNTSTVAVEARLQASADDMYAFMTDERRIPMWSRSPAKVSRGWRKLASLFLCPPYRLLDSVCFCRLDEPYTWSAVRAVWR